MTRYRRKNRRSKRKRGPIGLAFLVLAIAAAGTVAVFGGYVLAVAAQSPSLDTLNPVGRGSSSVILASDGSRLGYVQSDEYRTPISWHDVPVELAEATIAIEDKDFYRHAGIDYQAIARAIVADIKAGKAAEGGSTITQQLVRNSIIRNERTLTRKIREAKYAQELEKKYSKNTILTKYLNHVSYGTVNGQTAVGCEAAAQTYFSKSCRDLNLTQAALLAGLPQAPSIYNPLNNPAGAIERRNEVLTRMAEQGYITKSEARIAKAEPLKIKQGSRYTRVAEPYFVDYVTDLLIKEYGVNTVRKGGLIVHTTIDRQLQKNAKEAIDSVLNYPGDPSSAVVTIDPSNGYIRTMASNSSYSRRQFNLAAQGRRQPGSSFKPMALVTAIKRGVNPQSTIYVSKPLHLEIPGYGVWDVSTYDDSYGGAMNLEKATLRSDNSVFAQLALDLGPKSIADTAHDLGIEAELEGVPAETLGGLGQGVSAVDMTDAYATLADGGRQHDPVAIKEVTIPGGRVEKWETPAAKQVISDGVAYEATKILEKNVQAGTGTKAQTGCPTAGKTGTTDNFNDAWFVGYTPKLATAVWVGYPNALLQMTSVHGIAVAGGTFPAEIFGRYMTSAVAGNCENFSKPTTPVEWVPFFGKYSQEGASESYSDYGDDSYTEGKEKKEKDGDGGKDNPATKQEKSPPKPSKEPPPSPPPTPPAATPPPAQSPTDGGAVSGQ